MAWLSSDEALAVLGGKPQTLYANVSRGRIRAKRDPKDSRKSLYNTEDVKRLAGRRRGRRTVAAVAAETIGWGDPVLSSGVSTVIDGRLWYRGRDAVELSEAATLEDAAALLWETGRVAFASPRKVRKPHPASSGPQEAAFALLSVRASRDAPSLGRLPGILSDEAAVIVGELGAAMLNYAGDGAMMIHQRIAAAWKAPRASETIRRALVLLAEHELNASTFAVRVAASTGAPLAACLLAGLATLTGPLHGGASVRMRSLMVSVRRNGPTGAVRDWLTEGHAIPAFGHPLYPDGDIRARVLLETFQVRPALADLGAAVEELTGEKPNVDFALLALTDAFDLPETAPLTLFAIARTVGWIAHLIEQLSTRSVIRPRARYNGPPLVAKTAS
jgi:citrate synthase